VDLGDTRVGRTRRLTGGEPRDPVWNESFRIYCAHTISEIIISIKDAAIVGTIVVGRARIPAYDLIAGTILLIIMFATEAFGNPIKHLVAQALASLAQLWWGVSQRIWHLTTCA
jgi:hypothetical protein